MVCSNQVRENLDAGQYGLKYHSPGGMGIPFYSSLRLRCNSPQKIKYKKNIHGKENMRVVGVETDIEVFKSSVWKPYHVAPVTIMFDYGIDDIRQNLQFIKDNTANNTYTIRGHKLNQSLDESCRMIEADGLQRKLRSEVITLWEELESQFTQKRKPKHEQK